MIGYGRTVDVSLRQLRMLRELSHRGTIAATADSLGYTPSAVSQQLASLERSAGTAVLERVGRNVRLTDAGRELVHHAGAVLERLEQAEAALQAVTGAVAGRLTVSSFESMFRPVVAPVLARARERHPDLEISSTELDPDVALDAVDRGRIDLAVILDYPHAPGPRPADVERHRLLVDRFELLVPEDDPLGPEPVALADLAERDLIGAPSHFGCGRCVIQACRDAGFEPRIRHGIDTFPSAIHLAAAGAGVVLLPTLALTELPDGVRVVPLVDRIERSVELAHRRASRGRPALDAVVELFREVVGDLDLAPSA